MLRLQRAGQVELVEGLPVAAAGGELDPGEVVVACGLRWREVRRAARALGLLPPAELAEQLGPLRPERRGDVARGQARLGLFVPQERLPQERLAVGPGGAASASNASARATSISSTLASPRSRSRAGPASRVTSGPLPPPRDAGHVVEGQGTLRQREALRPLLAVVDPHVQPVLPHPSAA